VNKNKPDCYGGAIRRGWEGCGRVTPQAQAITNLKGQRDAVPWRANVPLVRPRNCGRGIIPISLSSLAVSGQ